WRSVCARWESASRKYPMARSSKAARCAAAKSMRRATTVARWPSRSPARLRHRADLEQHPISHAARMRVCISERTCRIPGNWLQNLRMASVIPILTIDGPSGSGQGTIARAVADKLGWHLLDSGALYRAVGYAAGMAGLDLSDVEAVTRCAQAMKIRF